MTVEALAAALLGGFLAYVAIAVVRSVLLARERLEAVEDGLLTLAAAIGAYDGADDDE